MTLRNADEEERHLMTAGYRTLVQTTPNGKQGHSCFGCCCDMRRAVIIVNIIMLVLTFLTAIFTIAGVEFLRENSQLFTDDEVQEAAEELESVPLALLFVLLLVECFFFAFGIIGALKYVKWMVYVALAGYVLSFVANIIYLNIGALVLGALFAYPHLFFIREMDKRIMTKENYSNEKQSCCCV